MSESPANNGDTPAGQPAADAPKFDRNAPHHQKPKVRPLRGFPLQAKNAQGQVQTLMGLADLRQISDRVVVTGPAMQVVVPKLDGTRDLDQVVHEVRQGLTRQVLETFVAQLDHAGLIEGPTFAAMRERMHAEYDAQPILPPASTAAFAEQLILQETGQNRQPATPSRPPGWDELPPEHREKAAVKVREVFAKFIEQAEPRMPVKTLENLPRAIVAPHLDYGRGWLNYASSWGPLRGLEAPDRVIILGTNHFGEGTGVVGCDKGFVTPLGKSEIDRDVADRLRTALGDGLFANRFDHEREHSIELQVAWMQYVFGEKPTVFAALVHDPCVNNGESYDGRGVALEAFVNALKGLLSGPGMLPGRTLVVASADLSHCGPAFGDRQALAGEAPEVVTARNRILQHDQEMLKLFADNKPSELVASMSWQQNPTRWCSIGNLVATLMAVQPDEVKLLNYGGSMDQQGTTFVSCASAVLT
jgi:AmmeMemoRadiSam system protein B